jgi:transcriptional regulator with XRE-family HTH domain
MNNNETSCEKCGSPFEAVRQAKYCPERFGLDAKVIVLDGAHELTCRRCGTVAETVVSNFQGLVVAVAVTRCKLERKLSGKDVAFLRKAMGWSAQDLADRLEVTTTTVSNWETQKNPIRPADEKLLRIWVGLRLRSQTPLISFEPEMIESLKISSVSSAAEQLEIWLRCIPYDKAKQWADGDREAA